MRSTLGAFECFSYISNVSSFSMDFNVEGFLTEMFLDSTPLYSPKRPASIRISWSVSHAAPSDSIRILNISLLRRRYSKATIPHFERHVWGDECCVTRQAGGLPGVARRCPGPTSCEELTSIALSLRERVGLSPHQRFRLVGVGLSNFCDPGMNPRLVQRSFETCLNLTQKKLKEIIPRSP